VELFSTHWNVFQTVFQELLSQFISSRSEQISISKTRDTMTQADVGWPMTFGWFFKVSRLWLAHEPWGDLTIGWPINHEIDGWSLADPSIVSIGMGHSTQQRPHHEHVAEQATIWTHCQRQQKMRSINNCHRETLYLFVLAKKKSVYRIYIFLHNSHLVVTLQKQGDG
jgi:hypothetical protein